MSVEIFTCAQGTPEWHACRAGIPTASMFATVMAKGEGKTRSKYMRVLAGEILTGEASGDGYTNAHMERGRMMEAEARDYYAIVSDAEDMQEVGFIRNGGKGCSPDRLIGAKGGLEIKTKIPDLQIECLLRNEETRKTPPHAGYIPSEHVAQVQGSMWVAEREWWDFVSYWPKLPVLITRVYRDEKYIMALAAEVRRFNDELATLVERLRQIGGVARAA